MLGVGALSLLFRIQTIRVVGEAHINDLSLIKHKNLIFFNQHQYASILKRNNPHISSISFHKEYPSTLTLIAKPNKQLARLIVSEGEFILGEDGRIVQKYKTRDKPPELPIITYYQRFNYYGFNLGEKLLQNDILYSLFFISKLSDVGIDVKEVAIAGLYMIVLKNTDHDFIFTTDKDKNTQYEQVRELIQQFTIEGKAYKKIDVRFSKPIVTF